MAENCNSAPAYIARARSAAQRARASASHFGFSEPEITEAAERAARAADSAAQDFARTCASIESGDTHVNTSRSWAKIAGFAADAASAAEDSARYAAEKLGFPGRPPIFREENESIYVKALRDASAVASYARYAAGTPPGTAKHWAAKADEEEKCAIESAGEAYDAP